MTGDRYQEAKPGSDPTERELAKARIQKRRDLAFHAVCFVVVNAALWIVWAVTGAGYPWPAWVTGGWAIGLLLNAWDVYGRRPITEADVRREMDRLRPQH
jgi:2TM domain